MTGPANYKAEKTLKDGIEVIRLADAAYRTEVFIVPSVGNNAFEMRVRGKNIFWFPGKKLSEFRDAPTFAGNPFLAPWANRLDHEGFYANHKHYILNPELKNYRHDPNNKPMHGLLAYSPNWQVIQLSAKGNKKAEVTSRLEFLSHPDYMAQFPFAHTIDMTYRLHNGVLEVETAITNHSAEVMPISIGFHPYFRILDTPRQQWQVRIPAKEHIKLSPELLPTGELEAATLPYPIELADGQLDDVFGSLTRGADGRCEFSVTGAKQSISVLFGPKYPVAVVYAPKDRDFICFEPMSGLTNAFNLHEAGKYPELQTLVSGGRWQESFWIAPRGY